MLYFVFHGWQFIAWYFPGCFLAVDLKQATGSVVTLWVLSHMFFFKSVAALFCVLSDEDNIDRAVDMEDVCRAQSRKFYDCIICNQATPSTPTNPICLCVFLQSSSCESRCDIELYFVLLKVGHVLSPFMSCHVVWKFFSLLLLKLSMFVVRFIFFNLQLCFLHLLQ